MYFLTGKLFNKAEEEKRNFKIHINNVVLHRKSSVKYLGVLLDESLNWTSHVKSLKSRLSFASSMIYKIRNFVPVNAIRIIYFCLVYSHLQYCIVSYGTTCDSVLQPLNTIYNNVLRALTFSNFKCHITPLYKLFFLNKRYTSIRAGVPNLGYMYPQGYIFQSERVHLRLAIEEQNIITCNFSKYLYIYQWIFFSKIIICLLLNTSMNNDKKMFCHRKVWTV